MTKTPLTPIPECNVGEGDLTYRQAANAIWNKLSQTPAYFHPPQTVNPHAVELIKEACELADLIVHHPDSGSLPPTN